MLKNTFLYYLSIVLPLLGIILAAKYTVISPELFVISLFIYAFVYRKFTDITRLIDRNVIPRQGSGKYYAPWSMISITYFKGLYGW